MSVVPLVPPIAAQAVIRGRTLDLDRLVDPRIFDDAYVRELRARFLAAQPFPHLRIEGLFDPLLLELVAEEFDLSRDVAWRAFNNQLEQTFRSTPTARLGPASELYFNAVNSRHLVSFLSRVTGVQDLIVDHALFGGGLHESRNGGKFGIHRDFERHVDTGLRTEMVLLTYLNHDWNPAWQGELELWNADAKACVTRISPDFGVSLLMKNGPHSYHGHPAPLAMPEGRTRRSLGSYYYSNVGSSDRRPTETTTVFAHAGIPYSLACSLRFAARRWTPPAIWEWARGLRHRYRDKPRQ